MEYTSARALALLNVLGPKPDPNGLTNLKVHFEALEGPYLIAGILQAFLCGIVIVQAYDYFLLYKTDTKWLRGLVAFLVLANCTLTATNTHVIYYGFVQNFGNYPGLAQTHDTHFAQLYLSPVVAAIVQGFFAYRSFKVNRSFILAGIMSALILVSLGAWAAVAIMAQTTAKGLAGVSRLLIWVQVATWGAAAADLVISVVFAYNMTQAIKGFSQSTDHIVGKLMRMALGTAGITTLVAVINALSFALNNSTSSFYIILNWIMPKLYLNCMLYVLNSRRSLRLVAEGGNTSASGDDRVTNKSRNHRELGGVSGIAVHLDTFVVHDTADEEESGEKHRAVRF